MLTDLDDGEYRAILKALRLLIDAYENAGCKEPMPPPALHTLVEARAAEIKLKALALKEALGLGKAN